MGILSISLQRPAEPKRSEDKQLEATIKSDQMANMQMSGLTSVPLALQLSADAFRFSQQVWANIIDCFPTKAITTILMI